MARKPKLWTWSTGGRGACVRVAERVPGGPIYAMITKPGGRGWRKFSLGHRDRDRAMQTALEVAERRRAGLPAGGPLTVAVVFDMYLRARLREQSPAHARETRRIAGLWTTFLGPAFRIARFGPGDWETFMRLRGSGELTARGVLETDQEDRRAVGSRSIAKELKVLRAACRRATIERTSSGDFLLTADPTRGLRLPVERNPRRPVCDSDRFAALLAVADRVEVRVGWGKGARREPSGLPILLRLAWDTGQRSGAILALRWSDWQPDRGSYGMLRWRAEEDKLGMEWWAPVTPEVRQALEQLRRACPGVGDAMMFPGPNKPTAPVTIQLATAWLRRAEELAGLGRLPGGVWHPFRRAWATARKHLSPKDVAAVGGWGGHHDPPTMLPGPDLETMESVVLQPRVVRRVQA